VRNLFYDLLKTFMHSSLILSLELFIYFSIFISKISPIRKVGEKETLLTFQFIFNKKIILITVVK